ncbi:MAG: metallophosphoesterase, partial [Hydrogenimonas sp.]|nr:metallophosphoesterase [Hydrogenimonas sp.]
KILFFSLFLLLFGAIHYLSYSRIVKKMHISGRAKRLLKIFLICNYFANIGYVVARYAVDTPKSLYTLLSMSIGISFILLLMLIMYELLHLLQREIPLHKERRRLFKRVGDLTFLGAGAAVTGVSIFEGSKRPVVKYLKLDQKLFGKECYRVVQISDMHIGGLIERRFVKDSVERINELNPDLVAITGDLTDLPIDRIKEAVDELKGLKSRFGTYYVPGNHEYFHGIEETLSYLKSIDIKVLENSSQNLGPFTVVGVYDLFGFRYGSFIPDIKKATKEVLKDSPTLFLSHQPRFVHHLGDFSPSLMLSGHTHGGQIWPFGYLVKMQQPYLKGLHKLGERSYIYVNSGIGFWGPPMRLGTEAEITCIDWS